MNWRRIIEPDGVDDEKQFFKLKEVRYCVGLQYFDASRHGDDDIKWVPIYGTRTVYFQQRKKRKPEARASENNVSERTRESASGAQEQKQNTVPSPMVLYRGRCFPVRSDATWSDCDCCLTSADLARKIRSDNIQRVVDIFFCDSGSEIERGVKETSVTVVAEQADATLYDIIRFKKAELTADHFLYFTLQIMSALADLHSAGLILRDNLIPSSFGVNTDCKVALLWETLDSAMAFSPAQGRPPGEVEMEVIDPSSLRCILYAAPEELTSQKSDAFTPAVDVWRAGLTLAEIVLRKPLFYASYTEMGQLRLILELVPVVEEDAHFLNGEDAKELVLKRLGEPGNCPAAYRERLEAALGAEAPPGLVDLLLQMLQFNPAKRISAAEALEHPYLIGLREGPAPAVASRPVRLTRSVYPKPSDLLGALEVEYRR